MPDRDGRLTDVVLGYDDLAGYEVNGCFFGATIGRSGNRIAQSRFTLDGKKIVLTPNEGANNLHSGPDGFEKKMWTASEISEDKNAVTFSRISPDGENGFPGEFNVRLFDAIHANSASPQTVRSVASASTNHMTKSTFTVWKYHPSISCL